MNFEMAMTERELPDTHNAKIICKFEWFTVKEFDGHQLWLELDNGEGMTFQRQEFMGFFSRIWEGF